MSQIVETKSNWDCVTKHMEAGASLEFVGTFAALFHEDPEQLLQILNRYKFASKMVGSGKRVLDIGCSDGLGTYLLAQECGFAHGVDSDQSVIAQAKKNFPQEKIEFSVEVPKERFDAIVAFGCRPSAVAEWVKPQGMVFLSPEDIEEMRAVFTNAFLFADVAVGYNT